MSEYIVDFGDDAKSAVRMAMARQHGAQMLGEIVRCRDCKWYIGANSLTGWNDVCNLTDSNVQPNDYCAWGKPKEEDE